MAQIFISYKRSDSGIVSQIKDKIEAVTGVNCWMDVDGIESDALFVEVIINAIKECEVFLFMYSKSHAVITEFDQDWTVRELSFARDKGKRIVFVNIDGTQLSDYFSFMFSIKQQVNAQSENEIEKLCNDVNRWLEIDKPINTPNCGNKANEINTSQKEVLEILTEKLVKSHYSILGLIISCSEGITRRDLQSQIIKQQLSEEELSLVLGRDFFNKQPRIKIRLHEYNVAVENLSKAVNLPDFDSKHILGLGRSVIKYPPQLLYDFSIAFYRMESSTDMKESMTICFETIERLFRKCSGMSSGNSKPEEFDNCVRLYEQFVKNLKTAEQYRPLTFLHVFENNGMDVTSFFTDILIHEIYILEYYRYYYQMNLDI